MVSCTHGGDDDAWSPSSQVSEDALMPVGIKVSAVTPSAAFTRAGRTGMLDLSTLQSTGYGIGVFSYYTSSTPWATAGATATPNFMYNQSVTYSLGNSVWQYEPIKYWPNDNNPADDQGATGSQAHSYLSFFAYAPYVNGTVTLNATDYHFDNSTGRFTSDSEPATYYDAQSPQ